MAEIPPIEAFTDPTTTEHEFREALEQLHDYLTGLLGTSGERHGYRLRRVTRFDTAGEHTYNKPEWLRFAVIEGVGGGGAGGSVSVADSSGAGGGAGGPIWCSILADDLGSSESVTVGEGGYASASGWGYGGDGGPTIFGDHVVAGGGNGGEGGVAGRNSFPKQGGKGGQTTYGDAPSLIAFAGPVAGEGGDSIPSLGYPIGGRGGSTRYGWSGDNHGQSGSIGLSPRAPGRGGVGAYPTSSGGSRQGTRGGDGLLIIWEYE